MPGGSTRCFAPRFGKLNRPGTCGLPTIVESELKDLVAAAVLHKENQVLGLGHIRQQEGIRQHRIAVADRTGFLPGCSMLGNVFLENDLQARRGSFGRKSTYRTAEQVEGLPCFHTGILVNNRV